MDLHRLRRLLEQVAAGGLDLDRAMEELAILPFEDVDEGIRLDHHRELRSGLPEVVLGEWKSAEQIIRILGALLERGLGALATRVSEDKAAAIVAAIPGAVHHEMARAVTTPARAGARAKRGVAAVVAAGTSDLPVAEEAVVTLEFIGHEVSRVYDVGVAGVHRVLAEMSRLRAADVIIVVAGMEGALPSVVAGLVQGPVVAVPTSVGYGASVGGFAALFGMLSSCSPGITVVNIDNGFGAAAAAARILNLASSVRQEDAGETP